MSIYHFPHHGRVPRLPPHIPRPPLFSLLTFHGDSLIQSNTDHDLLAAFETGNAELLYEIRLLSASSKEYRNPSEQRTLALEQALGVAETKAEANVILEELGGKGEEGDKVGEGEAAERVPVVRLRIGEVAETSSVVLLPISAKEEKEILEACRRRIEDRLGKFSLIQLSEEHPNVLGSIAAIVQVVVFPMFGFLFSSAIAMFYEPPEKQQKDSSFWALLYVGLGIVTLVIIPVQNYFFGIVGGKLIERIRLPTFEKVVHQEISWFDDSANSRSYVNMAFTANWILALIIVAVSPLIFIQRFLQMKFLKGFSGDAKAKYEEASQVANDVVSSIRTIASFCAESKVMDRYKKKCDIEFILALGLVSGTGFDFSFLALYCTNAFYFYIGSVLVQHSATFPEVFKVLFCLTITAIGISQTSVLTPDTNKAKDSAASIFKILDSKPTIDSSSNGGRTLEAVFGDIELQHVSFNYPTRPHIQIFKDLCLSIPAGKTVALVGKSGSGKSTVISLLERSVSILL
ncbi:ABC transporter B family member 9 [Glycine soja]|uniref:ABC transporter B family member 9 n=1 Tax=Glycine soja TaxID=3848 RepID=A0A445F066_GLYSO|nr:ABC transporter B family member 9 [Glycine soja]